MLVRSALVWALIRDAEEACVRCGFSRLPHGDACFIQPPTCAGWTANVCCNSQPEEPAAAIESQASRSALSRSDSWPGALLLFIPKPEFHAGSDPPL
jgi:hypothetical protein